MNSRKRQRQDLQPTTALSTFSGTRNRDYRALYRERNSSDDEFAQTKCKESSIWTPTPTSQFNLNYAGLAAQGKQDALANTIESMWIAHDSMHSTLREYRRELRLLDAGLGEALYYMRILLGGSGRAGEWSEFLKGKGIRTKSADRLANAYERSLELAPVAPMMLSTAVVEQSAAGQSGEAAEAGDKTSVVTEELGSQKMAFKNERCKKPKPCPVQLAVGAIVEGNVHPLDLDFEDLDPSPTALDIPAGQDWNRCLHHRWKCADCGRALNGHPS